MNKSIPVYSGAGSYMVRLWRCPQCGQVFQRGGKVAHIKTFEKVKLNGKWIYVCIGKKEHPRFESRLRLKARGKFPKALLTSTQEKQ